MSSQDVIKIALIDDHKLFREGVKRILSYEPSFDVVAEADDGREVQAIVDEHKPEVVLMDINMPEVNGIEATKSLLENNSDIKVIILSIHDDESYVTHALQTGAQGYLLKEMDTESLMDAIDRKSTRLNSSHVAISYAVFCLKKKKIKYKNV